MLMNFNLNSVFLGYSQEDLEKINDILYNCNDELHSNV